MDSAGVTVKTSEVAAVKEPLVPVMVNVADPRIASLLAFSTSSLVPVVGFGLNDAVTPLGKPEAIRLMLPANPDVPVTVIVDSPEAP